MNLNVRYKKHWPHAKYGTKIFNIWTTVQALDYQVKENSYNTKYKSLIRLKNKPQSSQIESEESWKK